MNILHCQCETNIASFLHHMTFRRQTILSKNTILGKPTQQIVWVKTSQKQRENAGETHCKHPACCWTDYLEVLLIIFLLQQNSMWSDLQSGYITVLWLFIDIKRFLPHQSQKRVFRLKVGSWRYAVVAMFCHMVFIGEIRRETDPISKLTGRIRCFWHT